MENSNDRAGATMIKSKLRVAAHGEVFTADREVEDMCDLVRQETERIDSRFLEPACGEGNFLLYILRRKLEVVTKRYKRSVYDWERYSLLALGSIYGVDIMFDNVQLCRERLYDLWNTAYAEACKKECRDKVRSSAIFILCCNIVCGDALTLTRTDSNGNGLKKPIVFSEWTIPFNDTRMQRRDYTFADLLTRGEALPKQHQEERQLNLCLDEPEDCSIFLRQYISHYMCLAERDGAPCCP